MIQIIINQWNSGFWGKLYVLYALFTIAIILLYFVPSIFSNPLTRMRFIRKAQKEGRMAVGKLSCWTLNGVVGKSKYEHVEYVYYVDGKRYFVTYKLEGTIPRDSDVETINPDLLASSIPYALILFYDSKKPSKVMSKLEVFASSETYTQTYTPKQNVYRDMERNWVEPINLVQY